MKTQSSVLLILIPVIFFAQKSPDNDFSSDCTWVTVGNPGFSEGIISDIILDISQSAELFVAFGDSQKVTVMKYDSVYLAIAHESKDSYHPYTFFPNPVESTLTVDFNETSQVYKNPGR